MTNPTIKTRFFVLSDTHGEAPRKLPTTPVDVAIHCGDLSEESKIHEFRSALELLKQIEAPLKLVIAGNHDFTMDIPMFKKKLDAHDPPLEPQLIKREYGSIGEARQLFESDEAKTAGVTFLDEGTHHFDLANGASLTVYASPFTPSLSDWGFQYNPHEQEHDWYIEDNVDVVVTHGPPLGILDYTASKRRAGSPSLFAAIARSRPLMHCFGHIHEGWGARQVTWRPEPSETPSYFTDIDNDNSSTVASLAMITPKKHDPADVVDEKASKRAAYIETGYCTAEKVTLQPNEQTLFVNAAIEGPEDDRQQFPWIIQIDLKKGKGSFALSPAEQSSVCDQEDDEATLEQPKEVRPISPPSSPNK